MTLSWDKIRNKINSLRDLTLIGFANILTTAIGGGFWLVMAHILSTEAYGEVAYLLSVASIAGTVAVLGAGNTLIVYRAKEVKLQATIYSLILGSAAITSIVLYFILYNVSTSVYVIGYVIFTLAISELLGAKLYERYSKYLIAQKVLVVVFALLLYYLIGQDGIVLGFGLSYFPYFIIVYKGFKETLFDFSFIRDRFKFIINSYVLDLSTILNGQLDKLIIAPLIGFALLGNYQLGIQVISLIGILPSIVYQYVLPRESSGQTNTKLKKGTVLISAILAILVAFLSPYVIPFLFQKFEEAVQVVQIMAFTIIPTSINLMLISRFLAREKSRTVLMGSGIFLGVQIPTIFVLIDLLGVNGVAISHLLSNNSETVYLLYMAKLKIFGKNVQK